MFSIDGVEDFTKNVVAFHTGGTTPQSMTNYISHQKDCPYSDTDLLRTVSDTNGSSDTKVEYIICQEHRCCVWQDLHSWFGFKDVELKRKDFHFFFTDVAHGGSGVYEKFIVSGQKTLEVFGEAYIKSKFEPIGIPADLLEDPLISEKVCQKVWTFKRVERLLSSRCISTFAKTYLAVAQILATDILCVRYVKACIGYACHLSADDPELIVEWLPILIEHMYFVSRLDTEDREEDNDLLLDIQEYFDYPYTTLTPRVKEIVSAPFNYVDASRGENLIRQFSEEYFMSLANEAINATKDKQKWAQNELEFFMKSPALQLFSTCWLSLPPYFAKDENALSLPHSMEYRKLCGLILEACYDLNTPEDAHIWIMSFIHRLRQIQIILELNKSCETSETSNLFYFNKEILKYDNQEDEPINHPSSDHGIHEIKKSESFEEKSSDTNFTKQEKSRKAEFKNSSMEGCKTIICTLVNMMIKYLTSLPPPKPEPIIATGANGKLFELKPVHSFYTRNSPRPYLFGPYDSQEAQRKRNMNAGHTRHQNSMIAKDFLRNGTICQKNKTLCNESVFTRNIANVQKYQTQYINKSDEPFQRRRLWSCKNNLWNKKFFDKEGVELWRPPAAIFMQKRKKSTFNSPKEKNINRQAVYENSSLLRKQVDLSAKDFSIKSHKDENNDTENQAKTITHDEETAEDNIKLKITYILPDSSEPNTCSLPLNLTVHPDMDDIRINQDRLKGTVLECNSDSCETESSTKTCCKRHCHKVLYSTSDASRNEINVNLVPTGPTGSPYVYIKKKKNKKFKGSKTRRLKRETDCCCDSSPRSSYCSCDLETDSQHETTSVISDYSNCCCCCCSNDLYNGRTHEKEPNDNLKTDQICDCNKTSTVFKHPKDCDTSSSLSSASTDSCKKSTSRSKKALNSVRKCISKLNNTLAVSCKQAHSSTSGTNSTAESTLEKNHLNNCIAKQQSDLVPHPKLNAIIGSEASRNTTASTRTKFNSFPLKTQKYDSSNNLNLMNIKKYKDTPKTSTSRSSTKPSISRSSRISTFDSSQTKTFNSAQNETFDSCRTETFDSSRTETSDSSQTETSDSSQTETSDSSRTETSDSSRTETSDSSRTETSDLSRTTTFDSYPASTFDSSQTSAFNSSRTSTSDSLQTSSFDSSQTSKFDPSPTATLDLSQTATSNSKQSETMNSSSQQTSTALSNSSVISKDSTQITSSCCSTQSVSKAKCGCTNYDQSRFHNYLEHCKLFSQSDTCGIKQKVFFSNESAHDKTQSLSSQISGSLNSLKRASTTSATDSFSEYTNSTVTSSHSIASASSSTSDLPQKHRDLLNHCRKLSREISGIVSKFDKERSLESSLSSKSTSKDDVAGVRPSNTSNSSQTDIASNSIRSESKKQADKNNSPSKNDLTLKHLEKSFCPSYEKSFQNLSDIFPTMYHHSEKKKRDSIDSNEADLYSNYTRNTRNLAPLHDTKKAGLNKFATPSYVDQRKKNFKGGHGLQAVYHHTPSVFVLK